LAANKVDKEHAETHLHSYCLPLLCTTVCENVWLSAMRGLAEPPQQCNRPHFVFLAHEHTAMHLTTEQDIKPKLSADNADKQSGSDR